MSHIGSLTLTGIAADSASVCALQTLGGAGNMVINGTLASGGVATIGPACTIEYAGGTTVASTGGTIVSITCTANISARTFTITGILYNGTSSTEAITGPNATTVIGTKYWRSISQIAVDGAVGTNTKVGMSTTTPTQAPEIVSDVIYQQGNGSTTGLEFEWTSGAGTGTVQTTLGKFGVGREPNYYNHATIVAKAANTQGNIATPWGALRLFIAGNTWTAGSNVLYIMEGT